MRGYTGCPKERNRVEMDVGGDSHTADSGLGSGRRNVPGTTSFLLKHFLYIDS